MIHLRYFYSILASVFVMMFCLALTSLHAVELAGGEDHLAAGGLSVPDGQAGVNEKKPRVSYFKDKQYLVPDNREVGAYYASWAAYSERDFSPAQVPVERLTDVFVAFGAICGNNMAAREQGNLIAAVCREPQKGAPQGGRGQANFGWYYLPGFDQPLANNEAVLVDDPYLYFDHEFTAAGKRYRGILSAIIDWKNRNPSLKIHFVIGGWSYSGPFYSMTQSPASRNAFVQSVVKWLEQPVFDIVDGILLDWEAPGGGAADGGRGNPAADGRNLVLLVTEMRAAFDALEKAKGREYSLGVTLAVGRQKLENFRRSASIAELLRFVDRLGLMTYDFSGTWGQKVGFNTAIKAPVGNEQEQLSVREVLDILRTRHGVNDFSKVSFGVPFYGRGHGKVQTDNPDNLPGAAKSGGVRGYTVEPGVISYFDLFSNYIGTSGRGKNGWEPYYYPQYEAGLLWHRGSGEVISYSPPRSMKAAAALSREFGTRGVFAWAIDDDNGGLLEALHQGFGHAFTPFLSKGKKTWIYAPECEVETIKAHSKSANLQGLNFVSGNFVYQITGPVQSCPVSDQPGSDFGWHRLGSLEDFHLLGRSTPSGLK